MPKPRSSCSIRMLRPISSSFLMVWCAWLSTRRTAKLCCSLIWKKARSSARLPPSTAAAFRQHRSPQADARRRYESSRFRAHSEGGPEVSLATMRPLTSSRIRRLSERVYEFRALAVQNRIHAELLRLAKVSGVQRGVVACRPRRHWLRFRSREYAPRGGFPRIEPPRGAGPH